MEPSDNESSTETTQFELETYPPDEVNYPPVPHDDDRLYSADEARQFVLEMEELIRSRRQFENQLYDFLVTPILFIDESFWEPVRVCLTVEQIESLPEVELENKECMICKETLFLFNNLVCCNQLMCIECSFKWFECSVFCPYCKQDLREKLI